MKRFALVVVFLGVLLAGLPEKAEAGFGGTIILQNKTTTVIDYYLVVDDIYYHVVTLFPYQKYVERNITDMTFTLGADIGGEWFFEDFVVADITKRSFGQKKFKWKIQSK